MYPANRTPMKKEQGAGEKRRRWIRLGCVRDLRENYQDCFMTHLDSKRMIFKPGVFGHHQLGMEPLI